MHQLYNSNKFYFTIDSDFMECHMISKSITNFLILLFYLQYGNVSANFSAYGPNNHEHTLFEFGSDHYLMGKYKNVFRKIKGY